jgi:hypothetical protein
MPGQGLVDVKFAIWDHAGKGDYLRQCLFAAGHTAADTVDGCDLLLVDCDWRWAHPRPELIQAAAKAGAKVALFPHGGQPMIFIYDGLTAPDPLVGLRLEHGPGSLEVAELLGFDLRQEATGWLYSPTKPFAPVDAPVKVLFAPQHPNMETVGHATNGHDPAPKLNQHVYRQLLNTGYEITVAMVGPAWKNGVWAHPRAKFFQNPQMLFHASWQLVQEADVVVGAGTVAATAVASGKPTVMFGQGNYADYIDGEYRWPDHWDMYDEMLRYPLDAEDGDLDELIVQACLGDEGADEWRGSFIGEDGTKQAIVLLEELVGVKAQESQNVTIQGVPARVKVRI